MFHDRKDQQIAQLQEALARAHKWMQEPDASVWTVEAQDEFEEDAEFVEYVMEINGMFEDMPNDEDLEEGEE